MYIHRYPHPRTHARTSPSCQSRAQSLRWTAEHASNGRRRGGVWRAGKESGERRPSPREREGPPPVKPGGVPDAPEQCARAVPGLGSDRGHPPPDWPPTRSRRAPCLAHAPALHPLNTNCLKGHPSSMLLLVTRLVRATHRLATSLPLAL